MVQNVVAEKELSAANMAMPVRAALEPLHKIRKDNWIVTTAMGSAREWPKLSSNPLDFHFIPSTMGGGIPLALGMALARPEQEVIAISGDGSLLMSLGTLVTVIGTGVTNLSIVLLDNGVYEVTGGQKTPATERTDFAGFATSAGFSTVEKFTSAESWENKVEQFFQTVGPRFAWLCVEPVTQDYFLDPPIPMDRQIVQFTKAI